MTHYLACPICCAMCFQFELAGELVDVADVPEDGILAIALHQVREHGRAPEQVCTLDPAGLELLARIRTALDRAKDPK